MNEIQYNRGAGTYSAVLLVGLGVAVGSFNFLRATNKEHIKPVLPSLYAADLNTLTYNSYTNLLTGEYAAPRKLEEVIETFYARLLTNQEPLGAVFEKVLNENIWNLYES
ncbi:MAG: hypothetical protein A3J49_05755 [Gallionellales bacterium RIFCSPHIGHO2_02_FULL_57_16]|nr:MAG: hypothetical protein A3J49_05755 [Gallionellales bacterium RIFCSPHIGHO2_02_FULL_57_16]